MLYSARQILSYAKDMVLKWTRDNEREREWWGWGEIHVMFRRIGQSKPSRRYSLYSHREANRLLTMHRGVARGLPHIPEEGKNAGGWKKGTGEGVVKDKILQ